MTDLERYRIALLPGQGTTAQMHALQTVVFELVLEVEAIRRTLAEGDAGLRARYAEHYRATFLASHSSVGIGDPVSRALRGYVGDETPREAATLRTLGVDTDAYRRDVMRVGTLT